LLERLDVRAGQRVLEIGCGPGHALREAARRARGGHVVGIDASEPMARLSRRRNRRSIARGVVEVRAGDVASLSLEGATFDRILSVHCIYFWRDVEAVLTKLAAALRPGGQLVLAFRPEGDDIPARFGDATYRFPRVDRIADALDRAGLVGVRVAPSAAIPSAVLVTASRP
jgi:SAM-dependent methyltransferase